MKQYKIHILCFFCCIISIHSALAQQERIALDSLDIKNTKLLFESYTPFGKQCQNKFDEPIFCAKEYKLFDNNINDLSNSQENALSYLYCDYELVAKEDIAKTIYEDKNTFRYVFQYKPTKSKAGNSCFSNPGALVIEFYLWDRLQDKTYKLDLNYAFYICDIQLLVNEINERLVAYEME